MDHDTKSRDGHGLPASMLELIFLGPARSQASIMKFPHLDLSGNICFALPCTFSVKISGMSSPVYGMSSPTRGTITYSRQQPKTVPSQYGKNRTARTAISTS